MAMEYVEDEDGQKMHLRRLANNRLISGAFSADNVMGISEVSLRDDDILLCEYPKCGGHWLWENLRMMTSRKVILDTVDKDSTMMEFFKPGDLDNAPSPRVLNNHSFFDGQPRDLLKGNTKLILLYRNPKDVAVSFFYHVTRWPGHEYTGSFRNFLRRMTKGLIPFDNPFQYWKAWEKGLKENPQIPLITVRYEDMHKDQVRELQRIGKFIGYDLDVKLLESIVEATSFDSILEAKSKDCLRGSQGEPLMYRKGKVGDWKNHFTVCDNKWFDEVIESELGDSELFKFIYSPDQ